MFNRNLIDNMEFWRSKVINIEIQRAWDLRSSGDQLFACFSKSRLSSVVQYLNFFHKGFNRQYIYYPILNDKHV